MKALEIKVERTGFPIKIGELDFFFGTTPEELTRFFDVQEEFEAKAKKCQEKLKLIKNVEVPTKEDTLLIIELTKELATCEYDSLLGEGTFEKIYSVYPDVEQLINLFDSISFEVAEAIEKEALKRKDILSKKKANLLKKKAVKHKKKK